MPNTHLAEIMLAAFQDGFRLAGGIPESIADFLSNSNTFDSLDDLPDMFRTPGGQWVWTIRTIVVKDKDKKVVPLDRNHFIFVVPHGYVRNEQDQEWLDTTIGRATLEMAGVKQTEISPRDKNFN